MHQLTMELFVCKTLSIPRSQYATASQSDQDLLLQKCWAVIREPSLWPESCEPSHGVPLRIRLDRNSEGEV